MDCDEATDLEIMKRTVALLFSFAAMAERAAARSFLVRCFLLWILRSAEGPAWRYVTGADGPLPGHFTLQRNSSAEALHLARTFRHLARMLKDDLRVERQRANWWKRRNRADEPLGDATPTDHAPPRARRSIIHGPRAARAIMHELHDLALKAGRVSPPP